MRHNSRENWHERGKRKDPGFFHLRASVLSAGSPVSHTEQCLLQNQKSQRDGSSIFPGKCCNLGIPVVFFHFLFWDPWCQSSHSDLLPKAQEAYKSEVHPKAGTQGQVSSDPLQLHCQRWKCTHLLYTDFYTWTTKSESLCLKWSLSMDCLLPKMLLLLCC